MVKCQRGGEEVVKSQSGGLLWPEHIEDYDRSRKKGVLGKRRNLGWEKGENPRDFFRKGPLGEKKRKVWGKN